MKKLLLIGAMAVAFAGCATKAPVYVADNTMPYADYTTGMASEPGNPMAAEWQLTHKDEIAKETQPKALFKYVETPFAAMKLLKQVKGAYETDPMVATKIAAISQLVMCPKCPKAPGFRANWTTALYNTAMQDAKAGHNYRAMLCLDQLRWCGYKGQDKAIILIGKEAQSKAVKSFAHQVAKALR